MFHCDQKWRARSVKREWLAEGRGNSARDNEVAHYIWGVMNISGWFYQTADKNPYLVVKGLRSGGSKILFQGLLGGANELCILRLRQIIGIYFEAMLAADSGEIDAVKDEA